jgi:uncharacterized protein (TIGR02300 family)
MVAKPEWGKKRLCPSCGVKFYDLRRNPVTCPKCDSAYPTELASKARRGAAVKAKAEPPVAAGKDDKVDAVVAAAGVPDAEDKDDEGLTGSDDKKADKGPGLIEDASELGEDEDDVAEVINGIGDDER